MTKMKYYRESLHLSVEYVARAIGVELYTISYYESEGNAPDAILKSLARLYGVNKEDLVGEVLATPNDELQIEELKRYVANL